jgi:hypothetical protein
MYAIMPLPDLFQIIQFYYFLFFYNSLIRLKVCIRFKVP